MFLFFNPLMAQEDSSANDNVEMVEEGTTDGDSAQVEEDKGCCLGSYTDYPFATLTRIIVILLSKKAPALETRHY